MFDSSVERTVIVTAVALWFAHGWYLNERLKSVHAKLDSVLDQFNGLREYLSRSILSLMMSANPVTDLSNTCRPQTTTICS